MKMDITVQECLCWACLIILSANPYGVFNDLIKEVGMNTPFYLLAAGAGSPWAKKFLKGGT